ncbi:MAG: pyruvate:ferredoxin (flavodoxin) oxidoreductase, partial [Anaerovoracaceae bacterium]|nr:pyruvate:ferredoxin (flavodoxin) oxidoreductase [Anaerovoracaceae bacterium]
RRTGTDYAPFNYYGAPDATDVVVAMGSVCDTIEEVIDYLNASGRKTGIIKVRLYRPFSTEYLKKALPQSVKRIAVLDRCKEPGSIGEPLYLDIALALADMDIKIIGGRYGLGSKDTQPGDIVAVFDNLASKEPKQRFTVSIDDDVTNLSIKALSNPDTAAEGTVSCKFWGLGADGTVGANKNSVKIIGDNTDKKVQAYFQYDSKKSGGITISHLRFGDKPIKSTYYVKQADFVACHNPSYLNKYNMVEDVKKGGIFLLNCSWSDEELEKHLPAHVKKYIASNDIQFYTCDAVTIARELGLGGRTNTVLQAAFFKLADIIPIDKAAVYMKEAIKKTYGNKGEKVVNMNCAAVDAGIANVVKVEVPESWKNASDSSRKQRIKGRDKALTDYVENILMPTNAMDGDSIPVSKFVSTADGSVPSGTAAYEKRGIAYAVPKWDGTKCMQCNWCSYVCPHAAIRPFVLKPECECDEAVKMRGDSNLKFIVAVSAMDCTGCGSCANVCPSRHKALEMVPAEEIAEKEQKLFDYVFEHADYDSAPYDDSSVRGSQFRQPLLEFSGACPGCGETPYAKLVTQLFGDRMYIANATGCSSIWGCSAPSTPYTVNAQGRGPAWANSLFEDNAEFGFGMAISVKVRRNELKAEVEQLAENPVFEEAANNWLDNMNNAAKAEEYGQKLVKLCEQSSNKSAIYVVENQDMLIKPSMWILGGDGWAYDIGYGGLDHVLATGENVNILVFDTEVYSNTGGQASKSTPIGAVAQFASNGKSVKKKDLAQEAMSYGYVYVAQIAMGANPAQALTAIKEAESYDGPSLIIAYAPCINHGLKAGMDKAMLEMKNAVRSGYWNLLRYDPGKREAGVNPLSIDNPKPTEKYRDFIMGEVRYNSLMLRDPKRAEKLFTRAEKIASQKYDDLVNQKRSFDPEEEV